MIFPSLQNLRAKGKLATPKVHWPKVLNFLHTSTRFLKHLSIFLISFVNFLKASEEI